MIGSQEVMFERLKLAYDPRSFVMDGTLNGRLRGYPTSCSLAGLSSEVEYPTQEWELNQAGQVQGGVICSMIDVAAGSLTGTVNELRFNPTVSLNVKFIRPALHEDIVVVKTAIDNNGRTLVHMSSKVYSKRTGKLLATAAVTFMNGDNTKEKEVSA